MSTPPRKTYLHAFTLDLSRVAALPVGRPEGVNVYFATDDADLHAIDDSAARDGYRPRFETMKTHLKTGGRIAVAEHAGTPVAWLMFRRGGQNTYRWLHLVGGDNSVFGFGLYTVHAWRGRRLASVVNRYCAEAFFAEGCRRYCSVMDPGVTASLRHHQRLGFHKVGFIWRLRLTGSLMLVRTDQGTRLGKFKSTRPFIYHFPDEDAP